MVKPTIGIALGSGGARGFAHLGVLKALKKANIPIDVVAGSSMGALVGSLYCAGQDLSHMHKLASTFKRKYYLDFTVPKMGFIQGNRIKEYMRMFTYRKNIEDLPTPLSIIATDLYTGEKVVFTKGSVADAVRASISIPGIFVPEKIGERLFIDGGVVDRVPVSVTRQMGADIVIGVDCAHFKAQNEVTSIYDVIIQSIDIMQDEFIRQIKLDADIMLRPNVAQYSSRAFTDTEEIIKQGEVEAEAHIDDILQCIHNWKEPKDESE
ncbi:patatin-like phospholipase family protein [Pontibacillus yanchengensis]|uniref:Esterase n=1 Tax=Pontibacillus yanchengensis Y32 TaxID=1385514 RepID=A0A0A2TDE9_9BACI|nr:patatin-like phospholipase family protein [Pontibacillus yanchengensis]KGP72448.1 esterase [Pontibacillus yanchengensis Y32]